MKIRLPFLSWIIIPLLGMWIATNYLVGIFQQPNWVKGEDMVAKAQVKPAPDQPVYHWIGGGLVTFWFDDAWDSQYFIAFPTLKEKGFKAALAVPTKAIGWETYMTWAQVRRLNYQGWEITAHSRAHQCDETKLNSQTLEDELIGSKRDLEREGYNPTIYVPPCGVITPQMVDLAKTQYLAFRTSDSGLNPIPVTTPYNLEIYEVQTDVTLENVTSWISEAKLTNSWLILMFHKIDYSFSQFSTRPEILKDIVDQVAVSGMPVVLPSQALNLVDER